MAPPRSTLDRARSLVRRLLDPDGVDAINSLKLEVRRLGKRLEQLEEAQREATELVRRADRTSMQIKLVSVLNREQQDDLRRASGLLEDIRVAEHVRRAVAAAALQTDPYEHVVVDRVFPDDVYDLLIRAIPPPEFFSDRDPIKQNLTFPMEFGPTLAATVWGYMDEVIARQIVRPAVLDKFHEPLQGYFESTFGAAHLERANSLPQSSSGGRLMLRRPGYHLAPHRDPKHAMLTCLLYLARPGDSEEYGTQVFRVLDDSEAEYKTTYYPQEEGRTCELVRVVPFKPNSMLVMLNFRGAHGATIPRDAPPDLERYTYQFYVAPLHEALSSLVKTLPADQRARWRSKAAARPEYA